MKFTAQLLVTEKCNLGCPYCYVTNRDRFMTREILDQALDDIAYYAQKAGCPGVTISYFGGEPLLNWDLIKYSIPKVKARGWDQNIVTNMTLMTEEVLAFCREWDAEISWSFDGIDSNRSRPLLRVPENQGYKKILDLYNNKKDLLLRAADKVHTMVYPRNCTRMTENFRFLLDWGISNPEFTVVKDDIWSESDVMAFKTEACRLADAWMDELRAGRQCSVGFFMLALARVIMGVMYRKAPHSCFACVDGCAIRPDGDAYPCGRFASAGVMRYTRNHDFRYYFDLLDNRKKPECKACDLSLICNAGCPYNELRHGGPIASVCDLDHIIYSEAARVVHTMKHDVTFLKVVRGYVDANRSAFVGGL